MYVPNYLEPRTHSEIQVPQYFTEDIGLVFLDLFHSIYGMSESKTNQAMLVIISLSKFGSDTLSE